MRATRLSATSALLVLPFLAGCAGAHPATEPSTVPATHLHSKFPNDRVQLLIGKWDCGSLGTGCTAIALDRDGAMWGGHFPFRDDELEICVRRLSASGKTGELLVYLSDPDKRTASDLYSQLLVLSDKVERALARGGAMKIFVEINIPWPPATSGAERDGSRPASEPP